jgi:glutamate-ammonia-ligase adenylyltransferase
VEPASPARNLDRQLAAGRSGGNLSQTDETVLTKAARLFWCLHASARLLSDQALSSQDLGAGAWAFLLRETGAKDETGLSQTLAQAADEAKAVIAKILA